jgi:hypothetical protein
MSDGKIIEIPSGGSEYPIPKGSFKNIFVGTADNSPAGEIHGFTLEMDENSALTLRDKPTEMPHGKRKKPPKRNLPKKNHM